MKRVQAGILAYGSSYSLPLPTLYLSTNSRLRAVDLASFVPDYSGVAVPDSHEIPFSAQGHLNTDSILFTQYHNFYRKVKFESLTPKTLTKYPKLVNLKKC